MRPLSLVPLLMALVMAIPANANELSRLRDRAEIKDITARLDQALDAKDWDIVQSLFADTVSFRILNVRSRVSRRSFIRRWQRLYSENKETFHTTGSILVHLDGNNASVSGKIYTWQRLRGMDGGELWEAWGGLALGLTRTSEGWRINAIDFLARRQAGNRAIAVLGSRQSGTATGSNDAATGNTTEVFSADGGSTGGDADNGSAAGGSANAASADTD